MYKDKKKWQKINEFRKKITWSNERRRSIEFRTDWFSFPQLNKQIPNWLNPVPLSLPPRFDRLARGTSERLQPATNEVLKTSSGNLANSKYNE